MSDDSERPGNKGTRGVFDPPPRSEDGAAGSARLPDGDPSTPRAGEGAPLSDQDRGALRRAIVSSLKTVYDPEIPVDIWELGLIYELDIDDEGNVKVEMTLTSPACPVAGSLPPEVEANVRVVPGVGDVQVDLVWEPPWSMDRMSEAAKLQLGFM